MPLVVLEGIQGGTRIDLLFFLFFFTKKYIFTAIVFTYRGLNSCIFVYFPVAFSKMVIKMSRSHFVHGHLCQVWFSKLLIE